MIKHILVAVHEFPQSTPALVRATEIARSHNAKITVAHILSGFGTTAPDGRAMHDVVQQARRLTRESIEEAIQTFDTGGVAVDIRVEVGAVSSKLAEIANSISADLIVMRDHQRKSLREKLLGSTADRIIRATSASVLVVKCPVERGYQNVVVAVDLTDQSESAAIMSAAVTPDSELQLVHVAHMSAQFEYALRRAGTSQAEIAEFRHESNAHATTRLSNLARRIDRQKRDVQTMLIDGEPASSLTHMSQNTGIDLIAVGSNGHGIARLALLGSVTQRLLWEAPCDVLICRPPMTD